MASQRPAWFRLSSIMGPPAPPPGPTPSPAAPTPAPNPPPPTPFPTIVRPSIPIRRPLVPNQNQEPSPPPPAITSAPPPPIPALSTAPPRSPDQNPTPPTPAPRSLVQNPTPPTPAPRSPIQTPALGPRTPVQTPAPQPRATVQTPAPQPTPPVQTPTPPPKSPVQNPTPPLWSPVQNPAAPPRSPSPAPSAPSPRSSIVIPSRDVALPPSPPRAPLRSPIVQPTSPPKAYSLTNSPKTKTQSPMTNSPVSRNVSHTSPKENINGKANSPPAYPKPTSPETTPAQSPKFKPLARSPSPFTLPPAQMNEAEPEIEQKTVLVQETIDKPMRNNAPHGNDNASNGRREPMKHDNGGNKKVSNSGMRVITLAGENKGAVMELTPSKKKNYSMGDPHYLNKSNTKEGSSSGERSGSESGEEGKSRNGKTNRARAMQSPPMNAHLNSNVQGVNNSILCNFTSTHNDPGIHLSLNRKAHAGHGIENFTGDNVMRKGS